MLTQNIHLHTMPTWETIERRLRAYRPRHSFGDHMLNPGLDIPVPHRTASVLILFLHRQEEMSIVFTQRTAHLVHHAGQVSFPGGRTEPFDVDHTATALREAQEEIGLDPKHVKIVGHLDEYITRSGFRVHPVVGWMNETPVWAPDLGEVEHIFEVPLNHILTPGHVAPHVTADNLRYYACMWEDFHIWGATAGMLKNLIDVISGDE